MSTNSNEEKLPPEINQIQESISTKKYGIAVEHTIHFLNGTLKQNNKDNLSIGLDILYAICDKSKQTIEITLDIIRTLLDHSEYWVRQDALNILKKIYLIRPDKFDPLIEKIESKLFDSDKKVRESAVMLIETILKRSMDLYPELYLSYARMFEDTSWTVRAKALQGVLSFISRESKPPTGMIEAFVENIQQLLQDPDEEVRGLATEVLRSLIFHLPSNKVIELLQPLLQNDDWEIREKGIWIVGEIGKNFYNDIQNILKRLVLMFTDEIMMIQTKVIDAFVKIGQQYGPELLELFLPYITETDTDINQGISETLIYISLQDKKRMIFKIIDQLEDPKAAVRAAMGNCLLKIYMESPNTIEEALFQMFHSLDPVDWRQRLRTVKLLGDLTYLLRIQSIAVWTVINLRYWQNEEKDLDVLDEIDNSLAKIQNVFENIETEIKKVEQRKKQYYEGMKALEKKPQELRVKIEKLINQKKFNEAEVELEEEGNKISELLAEFEQKLNESEFKRFSIDLLQDFSDTKDEILENVSDVKSVLFNQICDGRSDYIEVLEEMLTRLKARIDVLKVEYETIKATQGEIETNFNSINSEPDKVERFLDNISSIREKIYKLEFDIGQIWLENLEFKDFLKQVTLFWIDVKIEIQQFLAEIFHKFTSIQTSIKDEDNQLSSLKKKITFEFLNRQFQNTIVQAIQTQREVLENFATITSPVEQELKKRKFKEARHLISLTINNIYSTIENYNREINNIYEDIDKINLPIASANEIRKYLNNWNETKDMLLNRVHEYKQHIEATILLEEIREYLKYMNPIPLKHLAKYLNHSISDLQEKLIILIRNQELTAEIRGDELIQPESPMEDKLIAFYRKVEILGNKLQFSIRIYNPTRFFIDDLSLIFTYPEYLELITEESDSTEIFIREFEPEANRVIHWNFRIVKSNEKRRELQKFLMNVSYRNPFNIPSSFQKELEIIL